jgi:orotate phosphoribosyltransferase
MNEALASERPTQPVDRVISPDDPRWTRLHSIIEDNALLRGDFRLSSGSQSSYFFQLRQASLHREGARLIGGIIVGFMRARAIRCVGGLEMGAVPLVTAAVCVGAEENYPVDGFFVRKKAKGHGARELVDGYVADGEEILAVDDVTTTGGSMMKALAGLAEERNCTVRWGLSIVDREQGAAAELARHGVKLVSIFTKADFGL